MYQSRWKNTNIMNTHIVTRSHFTVSCTFKAVPCSHDACCASLCHNEVSRPPLCHPAVYNIESVIDFTVSHTTAFFCGQRDAAFSLSTVSHSINNNPSTVDPVDSLSLLQLYTKLLRDSPQQPLSTPFTTKTTSQISFYIITLIILYSIWTDVLKHVALTDFFSSFPLSLAVLKDTNISL